MSNSCSGIIKRLVFGVLTIAGILILAAAIAGWSRDQSGRAEAVRIASRAYLQQFGKPPSTSPSLTPGRVAHLGVRWEAAKNADIVDFGYQYVDSGTRRDLWGRPVPFASYTAVESFAVTLDGRCDDVGHHSGGALLIHGLPGAANLALQPRTAAIQRLQ